MKRHRQMPALFPGYRISPDGERRLFLRAEDVPPGWHRSGEAPNGAGGISPSSEASPAPPVASALPEAGATVPSILTQTIEVPPPEPPRVGDPVPSFLDRRKVRR